MLALTLALRLNAGLARDLWEDEVIAAGHAEQPFWRLPIAVMRSDVHPFLYFLQLHVWELFGDGDAWLRLNSVLWNLLAIASIFLVVKRTYCEKAAWIAAPLFALCAPVVWMAQELRPYSWLYFLLIWAFYFIERPMRTPGNTRLRDGIAAGILCVAIIYSHAIGFFAVFLLGVYALARHIEMRSPRSAIIGWALLFGLSALAAGPPLVTDMLRDANLDAQARLITNLTNWLPRLLLPRGDDRFMLVLAASTELIVIVLATAVPRTRAMAGTLIILPIVLALTLEACGLGFFKLNVFTTFMTPFFVIVLSRLLAGQRADLAWTGAMAFGMLFTLFSAEFFIHRPQTTGFSAASQMIRNEIRPGDVVYVPQPSMFGGMARYMGVTERAWQLRVAPVLSERWQHMFERLGPRFVATFELAPQTQTILTQDGIPLLVGPSAELATAPRIWLVTYKRADLPAGFPPARIGNLRPAFTRTVNFLQVSRYQ